MPLSRGLGHTREENKEVDRVTGDSRCGPAEQGRGTSTQRGHDKKLACLRNRQETSMLEAVEVGCG